MDKREKFWSECFLDKARQEKNPRSDPAVEIAKYYANKCLEEYDKTFKKD